MGHPSLVVRPAVPSDAAEMLDILRTGFGFAPEVLARSAYGCSGALAFMVDTLEASARARGPLYTVAEREGRVVGMTEFRRGLQSLYWNHIHVLQSERGGGVGRTMLRESLELARDAAQEEVALDVFTTNARPRSWYQAMGFQYRWDMVWRECALPDGPGDPRQWLVHGLPPAEVAFARYGFCQFTVETAAGTYLVGKLADRFFRASSPALLADAAALHALGAVDRGRTLLVMGPRQDGEADPAGVREVGIAHHMVARVDDVLGALDTHGTRAAP
jgi:ribosomal protein S18 acetylase RimI-like enzyme